MKKILLITLILVPTFIQTMESSLKELAITSILNNPRKHLDQQTYLTLPLELQDKIRESWSSNNLKKNDPFWQKLFNANNNVSTLHYRVKNFELNQEHSLIKIKTEAIVTPEDSIDVEQIIDCEGKLIYTSNYNPFFGQRTPAPMFNVDQAPTWCDKNELNRYGFSLLWQINKVAKDKEGKRYFILFNGGFLKKLDLETSFRFKNFIEKRAPLNVILLLAAVQKAHNQKKSFSFTEQEKKILKATPAQFEKVKNFIKNYDLNTSSCTIV